MDEADNCTKLAYLEIVNELERLSHARSSVKSGDEASALATSEVLELATLIQSLHSANSNLLDRANQVEAALAECQNSLQLYVKWLYSAESTITQQSLELTSAQEKVRCLSQELEVYHQKAERQQILTESLTAQLQYSQERTAQLEQECAFTLSRYNQQSHQLMQTDSACQELRARLTRQQSYTLQLRLALEKSPDSSVLSYQMQPIQSWSAQTEPLIEKLKLDDNLPAFPPLSSEIVSNSQETDLLENSSVEQVDLQSLADMPKTESGSVVIDLPEAAIAPCSLDEQVEDLLDTNSELVLEDNTVAASSTLLQAHLLPESLQQGTDFLIPATNWPSPVVYPSRPPKGRKSLSAIELPTFA